jgi:hypothetical protein
MMSVGDLQPIEMSRSRRITGKAKQGRRRHGSFLQLKNPLALMVQWAARAGCMLAAA